LTTEHDLRVEHPDNPSLAVEDYLYGDNGTFRRRGKRISTEYGTGSDVQVRVWVRDHHRPLKASKAYLLAVAALGWPGYWQCPNCDERVHDVVEHLNGHRYDTSPGNLKWAPDISGRVWHSVMCLENMMGRRYESDLGCPNQGPAVRDANGFMTAAACAIDDSYDDEPNGGLPRRFHSVTADQDRILNDPDKDTYDARYLNRLRRSYCRGL
jgi:hypothetical protein